MSSEHHFTKYTTGAHTMNGNTTSNSFNSWNDFSDKSNTSLNGFNGSDSWNDFSDKSNTTLNTFNGSDSWNDLPDKGYTSLNTFNGPNDFPDKGLNTSFNDFPDKGNNSLNTFNGWNKKSARVRVVHNVAGAPNVDVYLNNKKVLSNVAYKANSSYLDVRAGPKIINLFEANTDNQILSKKMRFNQDREYTLIVHGSINNLQPIDILKLQDNNNCPARGQVNLRFIHAAAGVPTVDVWANYKDVIFGDVSYGQIGKPSYLSINSGKTSVSVTPYGSEIVLLNVADVKLNHGKVYTAIASGKLNDSEYPLAMLLLVDTDCMTHH